MSSLAGFFSLLKRFFLLLVTLSQCPAGRAVNDSFVESKVFKPVEKDVLHAELEKQHETPWIVC